MNPPLLFLDFDGVLNTTGFQARLAAGRKPRKDSWGALFDPSAVASLGEIVGAASPRIVISSTWRYIHSLEDMRRMWAERGLPGEVYDVLPSDTPCLTRGEEVEMYLASYGPCRYVIVDDTDEFSPVQKSCYVETGHIRGLTADDACKAVRILCGL